MPCEGYALQKDEEFHVSIVTSVIVLNQHSNIVSLRCLKQRRAQ